jgi:hypothetical protein
MVISAEVHEIGQVFACIDFPHQAGARISGAVQVEPGPAAVGRRLERQGGVVINRTLVGHIQPDRILRFQAGKPAQAMGQTVEALQVLPIDGDLRAFGRPRGQRFARL